MDIQDLFSKSYLFGGVAGGRVEADEITKVDGLGNYLNDS